MNNFNLDKNTTDKLNSMLKNGNLNDMLSQIPPDAMQNFSKFINNSSNTTSNADNNINSSSSDSSSNPDFQDGSNVSEDSNSSQSSTNFNFNNIDMNTMMKMKSVMERMNNSSNPRDNLLQSLKPYLRDEKRSKLDQYSNLLNMANLMELFNQKNDNKENNTSDS